MLIYLLIVSFKIKNSFFVCIVYAIEKLLMILLKLEVLFELKVQKCFQINLYVCFYVHWKLLMIFIGSPKVLPNFQCPSTGLCGLCSCKNKWEKNNALMFLIFRNIFAVLYIIRQFRDFCNCFRVYLTGSIIQGQNIIF